MRLLRWRHGAAFTERTGKQRVFFDGQILPPGHVDARGTNQLCQYGAEPVHAIELQLGKTKMLIAGLDYSPANLEQVRPVDILFLSLSKWERAPSTHGPLIALLEKARPRYVVPLHFDDYFSPFASYDVGASIAVEERGRIEFLSGPPWGPDYMNARLLNDDADPQSFRQVALKALAGIWGSRAEYGVVIPKMFTPLFQQRVSNRAPGPGLPARPR